GAGLQIVVDGLALGVLPEEAAALREQHPLIALVHHPLALENGVSKEQAGAFRLISKAALAQAGRLIVTSAATARVLLYEVDFAADRITVAPPGNDPMPKATGSTDGVVRLLSVGSLVPRKGYDVLLAALAKLTGLAWQLTIAGDNARDGTT